MKKLNLDLIRSHFPALDGEWAFFDNAGGTQVAKQIGNKIQDYLYSTNVQLGASYDISQKSGERVNNAQKIWKEAINASHTSEIILGSSTTALLQNLSRSLVKTLKPGDEIIVSNTDHEANIGPWMNMENFGIKVKIWKVNTNTFSLELDDLAKLMTNNTRLVAFTHASNILGTINPIEKFTKFIHDNGALVCVDGVAYAPHRIIDVKKWDVDFYVFSLYKVYGPHYSLLFAKKKIIDELPGINHYFIGKRDTPYKLQPGNVNFELAYGSTGIIDYFDAIFNDHFDEKNLSLFARLEKVFELISVHEEELAQPLMEFLNSKSKVKIIGEKTANKDIRVPTISFTVDDYKSSEIPLLVDPHKVAIRWGDFYARRLIKDLNLTNKHGIVRVSIVHYNNIGEVEKLIKVLDGII